MRLQTRWLTLGILSIGCALLTGASEAGSRSTNPFVIAAAGNARGAGAAVQSSSAKTLRLKPVPVPLLGGPDLPADAPPNDQCAGAIEIPCGNISLSGNTFTARNDYDYPDTTQSCTKYSAGGRDVVYKFNAVAGDSVWLRYQSSADASVYLVTDCAVMDTISCVAGADENHQGQLEELRYGFKTTGTYYLILDSYGADTYGNWTVVGQFFSCGLHPPTNDRCETATALTCGGFFYSGDTFAAQNDYQFQSVGTSCVGSLAGGRDVVFSMAVTAGDSLSATYTSTADGVFFLMPDCPASASLVNCIVGSNSTGVGGAETIHYRFAFTGTYYLVLDSEGANSEGGWSLLGSLTCGLDVPTNDLCQTAAFLPCGPFALSGNNALAVPDYDPLEGGCTSFSEQGPDVVYRIDASPGDSIWCDYVFPHVNGKDDVDAAIYMVTDCAYVDTTCVAGVDSAGAAQMEYLRYKFTQRGTYYLILDSYWPGIYGNWTALGEVICPQTVGVGERPAAGGVTLASAFPNPFQRSSTLRFTLPAGSRATLRVHDIAGRVVRTLLDSDLPAGARSATWDALDDRGARVPGGTYFARLIVGDRVVSRTMILVR
jgi:hypothetical protein